MGHSPYYVYGLSTCLYLVVYGTFGKTPGHSYLTRKMRYSEVLSCWIGAPAISGSSRFDPDLAIWEHPETVAALRLI